MPKKKLKTIEQTHLKPDEWLKKFNYQLEMTDHLDQVQGDFDQNRINEIVLWKVNRFAAMCPKTLEEINRISPETCSRDNEITRDVLQSILETKGFKLPMASTVLRFRNPYIYQIIDQRVYRFIGLGTKLPNTTKIDAQISIYLEYLDKLDEVCQAYNLPFSKADRILYMADKEINKDVSLSGYGA